MADAQVKRHLTRVHTAPDQSHLGVGQVDWIELVLERELRTLAVSGTALRDLRECPADRPTHLLPTVTKPTRQGQVDQVCHKEGKLIYLPPTLDYARTLHGGANAERTHGRNERRDEGGRSCGSQDICHKRKMIPSKPDTSFVEDGNAGSDTRRNKEVKKKRKKSKKIRKSRAGDTSSSDSSSSDSEVSVDRKRKRHLKEGAKVGESKPIRMSSLQVSRNQKTSKTGETAVDMPPFPVLRKRR